MLAVLAAAALAPASLVSWGQVEITPPEDLPMGGYTARGDAKGTAGEDKLYSRCSVVRKGDFTLAIVSAELLTIPESLVVAVRERIPKDVHLMLGATHTHCAPDSQMLNSRMTFKVPGIAGYSEQWSAWYADRIAQSVNEALEAKGESSDVRLSVAETDASRGRREGALVDPTVTVLWGKGGAILGSYSAHATLYDEERMTWSGDWPGEWMKSLRGPVICGAIGDQSPVAKGDTSEEKVKYMADKLSLSLAGGDFHQMPMEKVEYRQEPIKLAEPVAHPEFAESFGAPEPIAKILVQRFAPAEASLTLARMDDLLIVGIPGEPTVALAKRIKEAGNAHGFKHVLVLSHVNGWIGYVLEAEDYKRGGYEATLSFHGEEAAQRVYEAAVRAMDEMDDGLRLAG